MNASINILADGIPPGLIFGAVVFVLWTLGAIVSKSAKPAATSRPSEQATELAAIRRRMLEEQARQKLAAGRSTPKAQRKAQSALQTAAAQAAAVQASSAKAAAKRAPAAPRSRSAITYAAAPPRLPKPAEPMVSPSARRTTETAKNVRLLLQRNGFAEAFLLSEIFGKPKGLAADDASAVGFQ